MMPYQRTELTFASTKRHTMLEGLGNPAGVLTSAKLCLFTSIEIRNYITGHCSYIVNRSAQSTKALLHLGSLLCDD